MDRGFERLARTAASQHGLLTTDQLRAADFGRRRVDRLIESHHLERVRSGVLRVGGVPSGWEQQLMAACLSGRPPAAASHRSALRLWGLRSADDDVEVSVRYPRRLAIDGVIVHRSVDLVSADICRVDGVYVTSPVRSLCDAGLIFPESEVRRMLDHAVAVGLVTARDLWRFRIRVGERGRNGAGVLHRVLESLPVRAAEAESGPEVLLMRICERFGLPAPIPQFEVAVGTSRFRVDAAYPDRKVFCEFDGVEWHTAPEQIAADGGRQNLMVGSGWRPLRFVYRDMRDHPATVAQQIRSALRVF